MRYSGKYMPCSWAAKKRRLRDGFFSTYCTGKGLDIGAGCDPVIDGIDVWDEDVNSKGNLVGSGDAKAIIGLEVEFYDFVYSSHCLEHIGPVEAALLSWWRLVKKGGFLIILV